MNRSVVSTVVSLCSAVACAATLTYTPSGSAPYTWSTEANWSSETLPTANDHVTISQTALKTSPLTVQLAAADLPAWVASLETPDGGAVVSRLANDGKEYLVAVNRSPEKELTLKIGLAPGAKRVRTDGTLVDAALYTGEYWIEPGTAEVFRAP